MLVGFEDRLKIVSIHVGLGGKSDMDKSAELINCTNLDFIFLQWLFLKDSAFLTKWKTE